VSTYLKVIDDIISIADKSKYSLTQLFRVKISISCVQGTWSV